MKFVIDASVAVRWYLADQAHPTADAILQRLLEAPALFAVPELFFFEVYAVLARIHPAFPAVFTHAFLPAVESGLLRYPMTHDLATAASAYRKQGLTGYDASYAGLAEILGAVWLTFDSRAHQAIAEAGVSMDVSVDTPDLRA